MKKKDLKPTETRRNGNGECNKTSKLENIKYGGIVIELLQEMWTIEIGEEH